MTTNKRDPGALARALGGPELDVCHPCEVDAITRRQLLSRGVSLTAYLSLAALLRVGTAKAASASDQSFPPKRKLIWITMTGGWDILEATDPKPGSTAKIDMVYDYGQASRVAGAASDLRIGRWLPNLAAVGQDLLVIRGLAMGTTSHPAGRTYSDTGVLSNSGMVNAASVPAIVASESTATVPIIQLTGGNAPATDRGLLKPISVVRADNLDLYRSMYPTDDSAIQRRLAVLDYLKSSLKKTQDAAGASDRLTDLAAAESKVRTQFQNNVGAKLGLTASDRAPFQGGAPKGMNTSTSDSVALALKLINNDLVTCVNLGFDGFDTHQGQTQRLQPILQQVDFALGKLVEGLKASGKLDSTLIVMFSDFGRTPKVNGSNGRDHWPVGGALVMGGGIAGGRAVGATTDDTLQAANLVDPNTGAVTSDGATGVQLNPTHVGGMVLALTLGAGYSQFRPYLSAIPALTRLKGS